MIEGQVRAWLKSEVEQFCKEEWVNIPQSKNINACNSNNIWLDKVLNQGTGDFSNSVILVFHCSLFLVSLSFISLML